MERIIYSDDQRRAFLAQYEQGLKDGKSDSEIAEKIGVSSGSLRQWKERWEASGTFKPACGNGSKMFGIEADRAYWKMKDKINQKTRPWSVSKASKKFGLSTSGFHKRDENPPPRPTDIDQPAKAAPKKSTYISPKTVDTAPAKTTNDSAMREITISNGQKSMTLKLPKTEVKELVSTLWADSP